MIVPRPLVMRSGQSVSSSRTRIKTPMSTMLSVVKHSQSVSSSRTRIKTPSQPGLLVLSTMVRAYHPAEQGLRPVLVTVLAQELTESERIIQQNKD